MTSEIEAPVSEPRDIYNGVCDAKEWSCGGFRFEQAADYIAQLERLPALATNSQSARKGEHVVTFRATPFREIHKSMWFEDATSLEDVLALWSFCGGQEAVSLVGKVRGPSSGELGYQLVGPSDLEWFLCEAYGRLRKRPVDRQIKSALLTYLEIQHVRPLQLEATLICSVLECLAPIGPPTGDQKRYIPIIDLLSRLPVAQERATRDKIEEVIVFLYGFRHDF
ncbi:MAG TPA: hypothetical protein VG944_08150, partial [Fimbriimonas sp.]|nr:hypothetical protein [Fimbriimonas sp.]